MDYTFVSLEGIDGTGKSSIADRICAELIAIGKSPYQTRDPIRNVEPWQSLYELFEKSDKIDKVSEALFLLSARVDNSQKRLKPALSNNKVVVADRYADSWFAYQSVRLADYFGSEESALDYLISTHEDLVNRKILLEPDKTIFLRVLPETSLRRVDKRATGTTKSKYEVPEFQRKVAAQYDIIAQRFPGRIIVVDTEGKDLDAVCDETISALGFFRD
ncbi:MAG: dTMP kinase [Nanoarchaeota archaeon]